VQRTQKQEAAPLVVAVTQPSNQVAALVPSLPFRNSSLPSIFSVVELSKTNQDEPNDIAAAVCFGTLFGDIDLGLALQWVTYNWLMGFDHVFMFYRPEIKSKPRFAELANLPYVTDSHGIRRRQSQALFQSMEDGKNVLDLETFCRRLRLGHAGGQ
jgi:hypothetical protein